MDEADGARVGEEPVPGMRLRCICRGHQGTIGRIAPRRTTQSPCGRFIASPSTDKTIRIWDANNFETRSSQRRRGPQSSIQAVFLLCGPLRLRVLCI